MRDGFRVELLRSAGLEAADSIVIHSAQRGQLTAADVTATTSEMTVTLQPVKRTNRTRFADTRGRVFLERVKTRADSPLTAAEDAWRLDTSDMTLDEVLAAVAAKVRSAVRP